METTASRGFGSPQAERAATRALELSRLVGVDTPAHFWAVFGVAFVYLLHGVMPRARELAEQLLGTPEHLQDPELLAYAHFEMGNTLLWFGELAAARTRLEQSIALYGAAQRPSAAGSTVRPVLIAFSGTSSGISAIPIKR